MGFGSLWHPDYVPDDIYQLDDSGSVISQFNSPSSRPEGTSADKNGSIWHGDGDADTIYKLDQNGSIITSFGFSPSGSTVKGVGYASNGSIWVADNGNNSIYELDNTGTVLSSVSSPSSSPTGVGLDEKGSIWNADSSADSIFKIDQTGSVITSFSAFDLNPQGLEQDTDGCIWHADNFADSIYKINTSGTALESFSTPGGYGYGVGVEGTFTNLVRSEETAGVSDEVTTLGGLLKHALSSVSGISGTDEYTVSYLRTPSEILAVDDFISTLRKSIQKLPEVLGTVSDIDRGTGKQLVVLSEPRENVSFGVDFILSEIPGPVENLNPTGIKGITGDEALSVVESVFHEPSKGLSVDIYPQTLLAPPYTRSLISTVGEETGFNLSGGLIEKAFSTVVGKTEELSKAHPVVVQSIADSISVALTAAKSNEVSAKVAEAITSTTNISTGWRIRIK